jgi:hypothetical protein
MAANAEMDTKDSVCDLEPINPVLSNLFGNYNSESDLIP